MSEDAISVPPQFKSTELLPGKGRGKRPSILYAVEAISGFLLLMEGPQPYGALFGLPALVHGLYRFSNHQAVVGTCPNCNSRHQIKQNAKPFQCKICNHRLAIYGVRLADVSGAQPMPSSETHAVHTIGTVNGEKEYLVVSTVKRHKTTEGIIGLIFIGLFIWWMTGGGENQVSNYIAGNLSQQYDIAARQGNVMDMCVQAGATAMSFLQAKDEKSYAHWKSIERRDCRAAGIPVAN